MGGSLTVDLLTRGQFNVDDIVRSNPMPTGFGGYGGGVSNKRRVDTLNKAYESAAYQLSMRRAVGQKTPKLTDVKKQIRRAYGLGR